MCKIRRLAAGFLRLTKQIRTEDLARDHPDNIVSKLVTNHWKERCRWKELDKEVGSWGTGYVMYEDCSEIIRAYARKLTTKGRLDDRLKCYIENEFPIPDTGRQVTHCRDRWRGKP